MCIINVSISPEFRGAFSAVQGGSAEVVDDVGSAVVVVTVVVVVLYTTVVAVVSKVVVVEGPSVVVVVTVVVEGLSLVVVVWTYGGHHLQTKVFRWSDGASFNFHGMVSDFLSEYPI